MSKHRDKRIIRKIEELEEDIRELNEENSQLRLLIEEQQNLMKEFLTIKAEEEAKEFEKIRRALRELRATDTFLLGQIHNEEGIRRDQYHRMRKLLADTVVDIEKMKFTWLGKLLFKRVG